MWSYLNHYFSCVCLLLNLLDHMIICLLHLSLSASVHALVYVCICLPNYFKLFACKARIRPFPPSPPPAARGGKMADNQLTGWRGGGGVQPPTCSTKDSSEEDFNWPCNGLNRKNGGGGERGGKWAILRFKGGGGGGRGVGACQTAGIPPSSGLSGKCIASSTLSLLLFSLMGGLPQGRTIYTGLRPLMSWPEWLEWLWINYFSSDNPGCFACSQKQPCQGFKRYHIIQLQTIDLFDKSCMRQDFLIKIILFQCVPRTKNHKL